MRLALNGATIMRSPLEDDVDIAAESGYSALEIWAGKLDAYFRPHSLEALSSRLHARGVRPWCINSIEDITFRDREGRRKLVEELDRLLAVARTIGAPSIVVVPGRRPAGADAVASAVDAFEVLRLMSDVAGEVTLAFEFLGKPGCAIPTLGMALDVVARVDRPNVGMVLDTFHFYAGGSRLDDIARVPVERLCVVHLNGCEDLPREELTDAHRLYPGEGPIPVEAVLGALRAKGFDGTASIEIFRPEYWTQDPRQVARTAHERATGVLTKAGYAIDG
jgi:2-keto-myo-inositol isomerase